MEDSRPTKPYAMYILGALLVGASFFIGTLWTKVQNLEKGQVAGQQAAVPGQYPAQPATAPTAPTVGDVPEVTAEDFVRGAEDAEITLIEYSDFECPFCKRFHPTMQQVLSEYEGKVKWVFRHFPLSFHPQAQGLAEASECVAEQLGNEGFWTYNDSVFEAAAVDSTTGRTTAEKVGVDLDKFDSCIKEGKYTQKVNDHLAGGQQAGVTGTPGTILITEDGQTELISGALPYEQIKQIIEKYL